VQAPLKLELPRRDLQASYRSLIAELEAAGERPVPFTLGYPCADFDALLARCEADARGEALPEGFVPHTTYWLVSDGRDIVGASNLRHRLNPKLLREGGHIGYGIRPSARRKGYGMEILRQSLRRAAEKGIARALVTCGKGNLGSARIIVANGGVFESEEFDAERNEVVQRYWIDAGATG
jgi:predicted acetyltransferase